MGGGASRAKAKESQYALGVEEDGNKLGPRDTVAVSLVGESVESMTTNVEQKILMSQSLPSVDSASSASPSSSCTTRPKFKRPQSLNLDGVHTSNDGMRRERCGAKSFDSFGVKKTQSIRAMALRQNSRQENLYIPQEIIQHASFLLQQKASQNSMNSNSSSKSNNVANTADAEAESGPNGSLLTISEGALNSSGGGSEPVRPRMKPNLQIQINAEPVDEPDWIQVSDA